MAPNVGLEKNECGNHRDSKWRPTFGARRIAAAYKDVAINKVRLDK
jgi:hypothetical protein